MELSAIIIACNEEENIDRCLSSLKGCIDDIVVIIDDATSDGTEAVVRKYKVNYEVRAWMGYSATKQYALSKTLNDWVLWIDADEALTPELKEELNKFKGTEKLHNAYSIARKANFLGRWIMHCGWYPGRVIRLFDKRKAVFNEKDVHEELAFEGNAGEIRGDLLHYTDPDIEHYFNKFNKYTSLAAIEMDRKGKRVSVWDLLLRPFFIFFKMYILKRGILDGFHGFILCVFSSVYVFTKYCKLWEIQNKQQVGK